MGRVLAAPPTILLDGDLALHFLLILPTPIIDALALLTSQFN